MTNPAPLIGTATHPAVQHPDGTVITDPYTYDAARRMPAFAALAKCTGGVYAENLAGMTVPQALAHAGLDFTVVKHSGIGVPDGDTTIVGLVKLRGTVAHFGDDRPATLLGVVGQSYQVVQPNEAANFGQAVLEEGGATVVAVGAYGDPRGSRMFLTLQLPEGLLVGGHDPHNLYLTLGNSWDRSTGLWACVAPIRIRCTNQAAATFGNLSNRFSIRHTGDITDKVTEVHRALDLTGTFSERYATFAETLLAAPLDDVDAFLETLMPTPAGVKTARGEENWVGRRGAIGTLIRHGEQNTMGRGTRYGAYQGVVEWVDWFAGARTPLARATRAVDGGPHEQLKVRAASLLLSGL